MTYKDLIGLHFGVPSTIRNAYKLLKPKGQLLQPCGVGHLNDETGAVIYSGKDSSMGSKHQVNC